MEETDKSPLVMMNVVKLVVSLVEHVRVVNFFG